MLYGISSFFLGAILGIISKYADTISLDGSYWSILINILKQIRTDLGIWILLASILSIKSKTPFVATLKVFSFFAKMLISYYFYTKILFGFFPTYYFMRWGIIYLISPLLATLVWFSRKEGIIYAFLTSLPISLLVTNGYSFFIPFL